MSFCRHRSNEHAKFCWDRCDAISVATERERAEQRARDHHILNRTADREGKNAQPFAGRGEDRIGDGRSDRGDTRFADAGRSLRRLHDMHLDLRHLVDAQHLVGVEIRLFDLGRLSA